VADQTQQYFNNFSNAELKVNQATYEVVLSFFKGLTTSDKTAKAFAENLFKIAQSTGDDVMTLLQEFEGSDKLRVTLLMAYYLNSFSDKTVMYGITQVVQPNNTVARNIVQ
jgi:hypothetical protein